MEIIGVSKYVVPMFGNKRDMPYGDLVVLVDGVRKVCPIKDAANGNQYITVNRHRYYVKNIGGLYAPRYCVRGCEG